jgi:predicted AlkP superfamily pyrophosphatase or phosphodiesterase
VVLITIDQFRGDYFAKFGAQMTGGLKRLQSRGILYPNARQFHALTETAPGHSTLMSGREPLHSGVFANDAGVPDREYPLLESSPEVSFTAGASPRRFAGTTLLDWARISDSSARMLSVSRKDRGAILPVGRSRASVFWYADGKFTTSRYYTDSLPGWVRDFNSKFSPESWRSRKWELLRSENDYSDIDDQPYENSGKDRTFPHTLPQTGSLNDKIQRYPWMDSVTLDLALRGVKALALGQRAGHTEFLAVSLSTTDAIGHDFGPDSRELHDHVLKLDRWMGDFLDSLSRLVPSENTIFVLSGDHGSYSFPEWRVSHGLTGGRINLAAMADSLNTALLRRYGVDFRIAFDNGLMTADVAALKARGVDVDKLATRIAGQIRGTKGVDRIFTPRSLPSAQGESATAWRRSLPSFVGWLVAASASEGWVFSDAKKSEHGTNHAQTMNVPILFVIPGAVPAQIPDRINTVDIAPTLAGLLGIRPTEPLDGKALQRVVNAARR